MDHGVNMGEILGPIVLAVVINVSPPPFLVRLFRANTSVKSPYCMEPASYNGTTTALQATMTHFSPGMHVRSKLSA